jgi:AraC-like DNA-binding protein
MPRKQLLPATGFCLGVLCYLLVDWEPVQEYHIILLLLAPTFATPVFFWLFSKSLFDDGFSLKKWMLWLLAAVVLVFYLSFIINRTTLLNMPESGATVAGMVQQAIALTFVILAIVEASRNREADLVVSRLQFRNAFILLAAGLMALTILSEIAFKNGQAPGWLEFLQKLVIAGLTFYFAVRRLDFKPGFFTENEKPAPPPPKPEVDAELVTQLLQLIEGEKYYRTEGLTIRQLAEKMEVKEYKLRQTINQHLGFRNFNDFLNSYRIAEACSLLTDPARKEFTVLEIAYEMGFNSLAPFNKAFKEITGKTPTEWRQRNR